MFDKHDHIPGHFEVGAVHLDKRDTSETVNNMSQGRPLLMSVTPEDTYTYNGTFKHDDRKAGTKRNVLRGGQSNTISTNVINERFDNDNNYGPTRSRIRKSSIVENTSIRCHCSIPECKCWTRVCLDLQQHLYTLSNLRRWNGGGCGDSDERGGASRN